MRCSVGVSRGVLVSLIVAVLVAWGPPPALGWGAMAHALATQAAIDRVPDPLLRQFLSANRDFMVCYSVLPDGWSGDEVALFGQLPKAVQSPTRVYGPKEMARHRLEIDREMFASFYGPRGPVAVGPLTREQMRALCQKLVNAQGEAGLERFRKENRWFRGGMAELPDAVWEVAGLLPWTVEDRFEDAVRALKQGDWSRAAFLLTVLGHYAADAHTPLHATSNYNGRSHPNPLMKGIHGRWESAMCEKCLGDFKAFLAGRTAKRVDVGQGASAEALSRRLFAALDEAHARVDGIYAEEDAVLRQVQPGAPDSKSWDDRGKFERRGSWEDQPRFRKDRRWQGESRSRRPYEIPEKRVNPYTDAYWKLMTDKHKVVAMEQLDRAAETIVMFWAAAWERAGKPALPAGLKISLPLRVIDYWNDILVPYDPARGPVFERNVQDD